MPALGSEMRGGILIGYHLHAGGKWSGDYVVLDIEQLEEAERLGWLCRDTTLSTARFYPNKFIGGNW